MSISKLTWQAVVLSTVCMIARDAQAQSYFDELAARSDVVAAIAFRSEADIAAYGHTTDDVDYDPVQDAMRFTWPASHSSNINQVQVGIEPAISSGNVFVTWEERWSQNWASAGDRGSVNGFKTIKNFQYSDADPYASGGLQLEIRRLIAKSTITDANVPAGKAGYVDIRSYFGNTGDGDQLLGIKNDFLLGVEVWARYYLFIEYGGNGKVSLWVSEPGVPAKAVYIQASGDSSGDPGTFRSFWFEHNSSQTYDGPTSHVWNRNFVVLDGVSDMNEALQLVSMGSDGDVKMPNPPGEFE